MNTKKSDGLITKKWNFLPKKPIQHKIEDFDILKVHTSQKIIFLTISTPFWEQNICYSEKSYTLRKILSLCFKFKKTMSTVTWKFLNLKVDPSVSNCDNKLYWCNIQIWFFYAVLWKMTNKIMHKNDFENKSIQLHKFSRTCVEILFCIEYIVFVLQWQKAQNNCH